MELFDQVTLCLGILERKTIALVVKARALHEVYLFEKENLCIENIG